MTQTQSILKYLSHPLDMGRVKYRPAPGKDTIPYLEGFDVIQTANDIFDYRWSFDLLNSPQVNDMGTNPHCQSSWLIYSPGLIF